MFELYTKGGGHILEPTFGGFQSNVREDYTSLVEFSGSITS